MAAYGVDPQPLGATDALEHRRDVPRPCQLRTWCVGEEGHAGACAEVPRIKHAPADFGPGRAVRR